MPLACPSNETIAELVCRQLAAAKADEVEVHVADCATCRKLVGLLARSSLPRLAALHPPDDEPPATVLLRAGATVGRYRILGLLGAGGMGVVYRARDPELDREIAIKLLHPELATDPEAARTLLLAEAQVMAKLRHPNVVVVHDVGTHGGLVFVAMELIAGGTLRSWLAEPRSWRDVLRVLVAAGRGLAAAHAQGIVHRDFKPENVLIGASDQVCVADFGLARPAGVGGDIGGTPRYMAPEQHAGQPPDPRADQYSYCAVLDEALRATRSSAGRKLARRFARRGLASDPAARYPSLDALLAQITRHRASVRRRWMVAAAAVLLAGAVGAGIASRGSVDPCAVAGTRPVVVAPGAAFAPDAAQRLDDRLAAWSARVGAMRSATCHASRVAGTESSELSDLRMECIADSVRRVSALEDAFASPTPTLVGNALDALDRASDLSACESRRAVLEPLRAPGDPPGRARFEALRTQLAVASAANDSGRADAATSATGVALGAQAAGFRAIEAEAWELAARAQFRVEQPLAARESFQRAIVAADAAGYDVLRAALYLEQVSLEDAAGAAKLIAQGKALADRLDEPRLRWQVMFAEANAACAAQDFARCTERCQAMLADRGPIEDRLTAEVTESLSGALFLSGRREEGIAAERKALAIFERLYGPDSPTMIDAFAELGDELGRVGRIDESVDALEKAIAIADRAGLAMPEIAARLADALLLVDRAPEALEIVDRVMVASARSFGKTSMRYAWVLLTRAKVLARVDGGARIDEALRDGTNAISIMRTTPDADADGVLATPLTLLGDLQMRRGHNDDAIRSFEEAIRIFARVPSDDAYQAESELGWLELSMHRPADARTHYERSIVLLSKLEHPDPTELAAAEVGIARALIALQIDHGRAVALLHAAHDAYAATGRFTGELDQIATLLK